MKDQYTIQIVHIDKSRCTIIPANGYDTLVGIRMAASHLSKNYAPWSRINVWIEITGTIICRLLSYRLPGQDWVTVDYEDDAIHDMKALRRAQIEDERRRWEIL